MNKNEITGGGNNTFYDIPEWVKNADDLNEYLKATGPISNIVKSLFSTLGSRHKGTNSLRDAEKMLHYSVRHILWLKRQEQNDIEDVDILAKLYSELSLDKQKKFNKITKTRSR